MSHNVRDEDRFYAVFQPSAFSQGIEPYYPLQPKLWKSPVYGQRVPWLEPYQGFFDNEEDTPEERIGEKAGGRNSPARCVLRRRGWRPTPRSRGSKTASS